MRIRRKPWAEPELKMCPFCVQNPTAYCGRWREAFSQVRPLRLELGCGKGGFIAQQARLTPQYNYLAIDIKNEMLVLAKRKIESAYGGNTPENVRLCIGNISYLREIVAPPDTVQRIYINFCNPWSHNKHKKRRLTHPRQLAQYRLILDGEIWFKTDDKDLFDETLVYLAQTGFTVRAKTYDLHAHPIPGYPKTEHEKMFEKMGKKICFLIAVPNQDYPAAENGKWLTYSERNPRS